MTGRSLEAKWFSSRPMPSWVLAKEDQRVDEIGGILLTQQLTGAERVGHSTSHIIRAGEDVPTILGLENTTHEELTGLRILHRDYLKDAWKFGPHPDEDDNRVYFLLKADDIVALVPEDEVITSL